MSKAIPTGPYVTFLKEHSGFTAARLYLIEVAKFSISEPESEINKANEVLMKVLGNDYKNSRNYFTSRLFITYIAGFEIFLQETVAMVIKKNPKRIGSIKFSMTDILDSVNTDQLIERAIQEYLNTLMYKRPSEYLSEICDVLGINKATVECNWEIFIEAKARRDLGVHNAWKCNDIYIRKIKDSGKNSSLTLGENAVPQDDDYLKSVVKAIYSLSQDISREVYKKHWPSVTFLNK